MADYIEQYQTYVSETLLQGLIPHYYGRDKVNDRTVASNGCIVWERSAGVNNLIVGADRADEWANDKSRRPLFARAHVIDIHVMSTTEELCSALLKAELQALIDNSHAVPCKVQYITYQTKNENIKSIGFYEVARVTIYQPVYADPNPQATITGFKLTNADNLPPGWFTIEG